MKLLFLLATAMLASAQPARFDYKVRELYFSAFAGNREALAKAMAITESTLAENPNHAEALVWHGGGLFFQSGDRFRAGDRAGAMAMMQKGAGMMDRAVELAPASIAVRIPRGSVYMAGARSMPPLMARPLLEKALADFETAWALQKGDLTRFSLHSIGELWFGIADSHARLGRMDRAAEFFTLLKGKLPDTPWSAKAEKWFAEGRLDAKDAMCSGCHLGSQKAFQN